MGEVVPLRRDLVPRAEKAQDAATIWEITDDGARLALPDPEADLAALPLAPLPPVDAVAARRREIEAALEPAGRDGAAIVVDKLFRIKKPGGPNIIRDEIEFQKAMIGELARYSTAVLAEALRAVNRSPAEWVPVTGVMVELCEKQVARRDELHALAKIEAERDRQGREAQALLDRAAEKNMWLRDLHARMATAGDAPSLADIELATRTQPILRRGGLSWVSWEQFAEQDVRAAAELCQRLARIARAGLEPVQHAQAIAEALAAAGFQPSPPRVNRERPLEPDAGPRRLSEIFATLNTGLTMAPPALD
jgi:hypothetical protein